MAGRQQLRSVNRAGLLFLIGPLTGQVREARSPILAKPFHDESPSRFRLHAQPLFNLTHEVGGFDIHRSAELEEDSNARTVLAQFQQADVVAFDFSVQRERFLRQLSLTPKLTQDLTERSF